MTHADQVSAPKPATHAGARSDLLKFPIGPRPSFTPALTPNERAEHLAHLSAAPAALRAAVAGLSDEQLDTPYRPDGWTVRQVVHHLADSHLLAYVRIRTALTEESAPIQGFDQAGWAELPDARAGALGPSLTMFEAAHLRLDLLLKNLDPAQFARAVRHPYLGPLSVDSLLAIYAWHARHHTAQITSLRRGRGW